MEACYMVSYFASCNFDLDLADARNRPSAAHLTFIADSPAKRGFKSAPSVKFTQSTISLIRISHYVKTKE